MLKARREFAWGIAQDQAFARTKRLLANDMECQPFDPKRPTELITDAARLFGMGFILLQRGKDGTAKPIMCGSAALTESQQRYSVIETELLAIQWAIEKCDYYVRGIREFKVFTDHKPLVGVFQKEMADIKNPRIQRLRLKIAHYNFSVAWIPAKNNLMADALSLRVGHPILIMCLSQVRINGEGCPSRRVSGV